MGINFAKSALNVYPASEIDTINNSLKVSFETELIQSEIRYTLDGSDPDRLSKLYSSPFELNKTTLVKAGIFKEGMASIEINDKWGFIDADGNIVIEPKYSYVQFFSEGLAGVQVDGKYGFIRVVFRGFGYPGRHLADQPEFRKQGCVNQCLDIPTLMPDAHCSTNGIVIKRGIPFIAEVIQPDVSAIGNGAVICP